MLVKVRGTFQGVVTGNGTVEYPTSYRDGAKIAGGAFKFKIVGGLIKAEDGLSELVVLGAGLGQATPPTLKLIAVPILPGKPFVVEFLPVPNAAAQGADVVDVNLPPADVAVVIPRPEVESLKSAKNEALNAAAAAKLSATKADLAALSGTAKVVPNQAARLALQVAVGTLAYQIDTDHYWQLDVGGWTDLGQRAVYGTTGQNLFALPAFPGGDSGKIVLANLNSYQNLTLADLNALNMNRLGIRTPDGLLVVSDGVVGGYTGLTRLWIAAVTGTPQAGLNFAMYPDIAAVQAAAGAGAYMVVGTAISGTSIDFNFQLPVLPDVGGLTAFSNLAARNATLLRPAEVTTIPRQSRRPIITVIFDDGYIQDWMVCKPMLDARGAKAAFAAVTSFMNSGANFLNTQQMLQLQAEGHTIMSHSLTHKDQTTYGADLAGLDNDLKSSRDILNGLGFFIEHYVYPFTSTNLTVTEYARRYYRSAVGIGAEVQVPPLMSYAVKRMPVTNDTTLAQLKAWADAVLAKVGWGVMLVHSGYDFNPTVKANFEQFMDYAIQLGIKFENYDTGFAVFGNQLDSGALNVRAGTVIDRDGILWSYQAGGYLQAPLNTFNGNSPRTAFPQGKVSHAAFSSVNNAGLPCSAGSLVTDRTVGDDTYGYNGWNRQTVFDYNSDISWQRRAITDTTWTGWVEVSNSRPAALSTDYNAFDGLSPIGAFRAGCTTVVPFNNGGNGTDRGYPAGYYAGVLTTIRTYAGNGWDYQMVKKYNSTEQQTRTTDGNGNWGGWLKINA